MAAAWNDVPASGGLSECAALVRSAEALRASAPELSVQLARRALLIGATDLSASTTNAGESRTLSMRAQALLAAGLVRISQHASAVEPGFAALALAESGGALVLAAELRLDLAACAQDVGEPLLGGALLRPVLEAGQAPPSVRAVALGRLVACVAHVARRDDVEDALAEADRLLAADDGLNPDVRRMERARLAVRSAAYHRWYGDNEDAVNAARDGLALLGRLGSELRAESDRLRARLVLELVCALLDEGEPREAEAAARSTVDQPVRATSAASVGQLMLAVATRVNLPAGEVDRGRGLLDQAAWLAKRHGLDSMLADALTEVSRLDEQAGRMTDALEAMRSARAAEQRRMRSVARAARHVLVQVGAGSGARDVTQQAVAALLRQLAHPSGVPVSMAPPPATRQPMPTPRTASEPHTEATSGDLADQADTDQGTGLLSREGLVRRLRSVRKGERPVALTLVRFEPNNDNTNPGDEDRGPDTGIMAGLADKLRDIAPENAELARPDGGELAVFLPHTTRDQAEEFAATIRETAMESDWLAGHSGKDMSISTGVVQSNGPTTDDDPQVDAAGMLTAARDALTQTPATTSTTFLADTAAALNTALVKPNASGPPAAPDPPQPTDHTTAPSTPLPHSALSEETPTTPLNAATPNNSPTTGRSILNALSIPSGSGGRRRADGEPAPGSKTRRPTEPTEAPRWTHTEPQPKEPTGHQTEEPTGSRAEELAGRSAAAEEHRDHQQHQDGAVPESTGHWAEESTGSSGEGSAGRWAEESAGRGAEESAGRRAEGVAGRLADESTGLADPMRPSDIPASTPTSGWPAEPDISQPLRRTAAELKTFDTQADTTAADRASSYEETRAELARMMSALNAKAFRSRSHKGDKPATHESTDKPAVADTGDVDLWQDITGNNNAIGQHTPAGHPDSAGKAESPSLRDSAGLLGDSAAKDGSAGLGASGSLRNSVSFSGSSGLHGPAGEDGSAGLHDFSDQHDLVDRSGSTSHVDYRDLVSESESAGLRDVVEYRDLGGYYGAGDGQDILAPQQSVPTPPEPDEMPEPPGRPDIPEPPRRPDIPEPDEPDPIPPAPPEPGPVAPAEYGESTRSRLMAAFDALTGPLSPPPAFEYDGPADDSEARRETTGGQSSFRIEFESGRGLPARRPSTSWAELESASAVESPADDLFGAPVEKPKKPFKSSLGAAFADFHEEAAPAEPSGASEEPSAASAALEAPTYDQPIGPERQPEGRPRRGERSATTIASLLTEALAAYQSTADDEGEPHRAPDRYDSFVGDDHQGLASEPGRHRSPE